MGLMQWRRRRLVGAAVAVAAAVGVGIVPAWAAVTWEQAVPAGFAAGVQSTSPNNFFYSVSCVSAGNCTAVGRVKIADGNYQPFAQTSTNGVWAEAVVTPFADGVQSANPDADLKSVSCSSAGNCTAVGSFRDVNGRTQAFVQTSTNGVWADAVPAPFADGVQNVSPNALLNAVSCVSAGNCTAVGRFFDSNGHAPAFTLTSTNGVWADAVATVFAGGVENASPYANFYSVSCASAGNCTAAGRFSDVNGKFQGFTQTSTGGVWANAVPASFEDGVQSADPAGSTDWVSCASAGNCTAVGSFKDAGENYQAFAQTMTGGVWAKAVPAAFGAGVQSTSPNANFNAVSCVSAGNCTAVGSFKDAAGNYQAFAQTMTGGVWANAVPASFAAGVQNEAPSDRLFAVSCVSAGNCTAVGSFKDAAGNTQAFTQTSTNGVWAEGVPAVFAAGVQRTNPDTRLLSVSCVSSGYCTAVGDFKDANNYRQVFRQSTTGSAILPPTGSRTANLAALAVVLLAVGTVFALPRRRRRRPLGR